ncbi:MULTISPECIES: (Fe-S)-binding protein [unclassified Mucilaginibacter]|uniref:(Fe-S)-binding protein n=1 Tax=unclassified Mucilaginibacter TaxID=2617802 RepID=UPI002AC99A80|nr:MULTISPECIES: (Fe-S)-binding protein [unclassified Mucilaginibacter]WPX22389.1 (Fe-S)-binding protein [Mucilaginibacter sp. 5C4]
MKNEYPSLGGNYEAIYLMQLLQDLLNHIRIKVERGSFEGKKITFHDPCYLGRGNDVYQTAGEVILNSDV